MSDEFKDRNRNFVILIQLNDLEKAHSEVSCFYNLFLMAPVMTAFVECSCSKNSQDQQKLQNLVVIRASQNFIAKF